MTTVLLVLFCLDSLILLGFASTPLVKIHHPLAFPSGCQKCNFAEVHWSLLRVLNVFFSLIELHHYIVGVDEKFLPLLLVRNAICLSGESGVCNS
jgi:hypothetical protein